jgi:hypothetical protein
MKRRKKHLSFHVHFYTRIERIKKRKRIGKSDHVRKLLG